MTALTACSSLVFLNRRVHCTDVDLRGLSSERRRTPVFFDHARLSMLDLNFQGWFGKNEKS